MFDVDGGGGAVLFGPDGGPVRVVVPEHGTGMPFLDVEDVDLPHGVKVDRSVVEGWPPPAEGFAGGDAGAVETMVALRVPPQVGALYGGDAAGVDLLPLQDRHVTLVYLGALPSGDRERLHGTVRRWLAEAQWPSLQGRAQGWGTFTTSASDEANVLWMGWDIPGLSEMRHDLKETLQGDGFECADDHDFVPHETVGYCDGPIGGLPVFPGEVGHTFDGVTVAEGDEWTEYPLSSGLVLASGRTAIVAALEEAASRYEDAVSAVLDGGFTAAFDSELVGEGASGAFAAASGGVAVGALPLSAGERVPGVDVPVTASTVVTGLDTAAHVGGLIDGFQVFGVDASGDTAQMIEVPGYFWAAPALFGQWSDTGLPHETVRQPRLPLPTDPAVPVARVDVPGPYQARPEIGTELGDRTGLGPGPDSLLTAAAFAGGRGVGAARPSVDLVVAKAQSQRRILDLPIAAFHDTLATGQGTAHAYLQDRRGNRIPVTPQTPVVAVTQFLRTDRATATLHRAYDGALLASAALWVTGDTPTLVVGAAPAPDLRGLRAALDAADGQWSSLIAAGSIKGHTTGAARLKAYWSVGEGGRRKIRWGTKGDWTRCRRHLSKYLGPRAAGYCFTGDTEFLTRDGVMTFADAAGTRQFVLTSRFELGHRTIDGPKRDGYWVEAPISSFGEQPVLSVTLRRGGVDKVVRATPEHRWLASPNGRNIRRRDLYKVTTAELQPGMVLASLLPGRDDDLHLSPDGIRAGIVFGDGYRTSKNRSSVFLWGEKQGDLLDYFDGYRKGVQKELATGVLGTEVLSLPGVYKDAPSVDADKDYLYGWLAGYFAADGSVSRGGKGAPVLSSASREDIERAKHVATLLGIGTGSITSVMRVGYGSEESELFRMTFARWSLTPDFFLRRAHREHFGAGTGKSSGRWTVVSVEDLGEVEEVFCATVPETEVFTLTDGIASFNCTNIHKMMTGEHTGSMSHRIKFGWGGKPGSYWAKVAAKKGVRASGEGADVDDSLVMMVPSADVPQQAFRIPLLLPEGVESGDGRTFEKGVVDVRNLPIPLLWQPNSMQGHDGAMIVGRIDRMERTDEGIGNCQGVFDTSPMALEAVRMIREGFLRGVSADLDRFEAKIVGKGGGVAVTGETGSDEKKDKDDDVVAPDKMSIKSGRIMAATLVAKPAFEHASIELVDSTDGAEGEGDVDEVLVREDPVAVTASAGVLPDGVYRGEFDAGLRESAAGYARRAVRSMRFRERLTEFADGSAPLVASVVPVPVAPPKSWFTDPGLPKPTHLTITDEGRVFGHIAAWHVDHIGMGFGTRPPKSKSNYSYFRTGVLRTGDGDDVRVGQLTLAGGHASLQADAQSAVKHYDDTDSAFADVVAGEDRHGIWVAGALRPGVTAEQLRVARASSPSGDWRPINGRLELVAVCQVNVPGFPVVEARVASGAVMALVAAGTAPLVASLVSGERVDVSPVDVDAVLAEAEAVAAAAVVDGDGAASGGGEAALFRAVGEFVAGRGGSAGDVVAQAEVLGLQDSLPVSVLDAWLAETEASVAETQADVVGAAGGGDVLLSVVDEATLTAAVGEFVCGRGAWSQDGLTRRAVELGLSDVLPSGWAEAAVVVDAEDLASIVDEVSLSAAVGEFVCKKGKRSQKGIMKRAGELGLSALLPSGWADVVPDVAAVVPAVDVPDTAAVVPAVDVPDTAAAVPAVDVPDTAAADAVSATVAAVDADDVVLRRPSIREVAAVLAAGAEGEERERPLTVREAAAMLAMERLEAAALSARERFHGAAPMTADAGTATADADADADGGAWLDVSGLSVREVAAVLFAVRQERAVTAAARHALPDGSFRIMSGDDVRGAVEEFGSVPADRRDVVRSHIVRRASALGVVELLPVWWREGEFSKQPVSSERRKVMAKEHTALPDGSYPIADAADLKRAIQSYGRAKESDRKKVRDHIMKRARALGKTDMIPESWKK